jgi:alpha-L-fucosidase
VGELARAVRDEGLVFGASSHRAEHWWFFDRAMLHLTDVADPANAALYGPASCQRTAESQSEPPDKAFLDDWLLRCGEIVDKYQPSVLYLDWWIFQPAFQPYLQRLAAYYYNQAAARGEQVAINFKQQEGESFPLGAGVLDMERGQAPEIRPDFWQTCTSVSIESWGYVENDKYKEPRDLVHDLVDIVSKNGAMLLNIGPKSDGTIGETEQKILREIGRWLAVNGEAIYGTRPWKRFGEGPTQALAGPFTDKLERPSFTSADFRFTTKGDALYAVALAWPDSRQLTVKCLGTGAAESAGEVRSVELLGSGAKLQWNQTADGLEVSLPEEPPSDFAVTLKIVGPAVR